MVGLAVFRLGGYFEAYRGWSNVLVVRVVEGLECWEEEFSVCVGFHQEVNGLQDGDLGEEYVHGLSMDQQQDLGLQGVGPCLCDQGVCVHDGVGSVESEGDHDDDHGL